MYQELLEAIRFIYGFNNSQAKSLIPLLNEEQKKELIKFYKTQAKLAFAND